MRGKKNSTSGIVKGVCLAKMGKIAVAPMFLIMSFMTWVHRSFWVHDLNLLQVSFPEMTMSAHLWFTD